MFLHTLESSHILINGTNISFTWFKDFSQQSVLQPFRVMGGVPAADVDEQTLVPAALLLSHTVYRHLLLRLGLYGSTAGRH